MSIISTKPTDEDLKDAWKDEYGVSYSKDGKKLLGFPEKGLTEYSVRPGMEIICDKAFYFCILLETITIPDTVTAIGESAFDLCFQLRSVNIPDSVTRIGDSAFYGCI